MILVDTSAWVEFDRGTDSPADLRLQHLIASGADIAVSEPILTLIRRKLILRALRTELSRTQREKPP